LLAGIFTRPLPINLSVLARPFLSFLNFPKIHRFKVLVNNSPPPFFPPQKPGPETAKNIGGILKFRDYFTLIARVFDARLSIAWA
jgi:hypothetical protein